MSIVPSVPLFKLFSTGIVEHHTKRDDFFMAWQGLEFFFLFSLVYLYDQSGLQKNKAFMYSLFHPIFPKAILAMSHVP